MWAVTPDCHENRGLARSQGKEIGKRKAGEWSQQANGGLDGALKNPVAKSLDWQKAAARVEDGWQTVKGKKAKKETKDTFAMVLRSQMKKRQSRSHH